MTLSAYQRTEALSRHQSLLRFYLLGAICHHSYPSRSYPSLLYRLKQRNDQAGVAVCQDGS